MKRPFGFSLLEVMLAFSIAAIVLLASYKQQWYLQKIVLQLISDSKVLQEKSNLLEHHC